MSTNRARAYSRWPFAVLYCASPLRSVDSLGQGCLAIAPVFTQSATFLNRGSYCNQQVKFLLFLELSSEAGLYFTTPAYVPQALSSRACHPRYLHPLGSPVGGVSPLPPTTL